MEKKVLLKDLVEFGSNVRREFISKVRVSDEGLYPIGELWDANTTLDMIVNGAHEQHDTIRELDEFAHSTQFQLEREIARAKAAEENLDNIKADKSSVYTKEETYSKEEVDNLIGTLGQIPDEYAIYSYNSYNEDGSVLYGTGKVLLTGVVSGEYTEVVVIESTSVDDNNMPVGQKFYIRTDAVADGETLNQLYNEDKEPVGISIKEIEVSPTTYKTPNIKEYIDYMISQYSGGGQSGPLGPNTVDSENIIDGTIKMQDLNDEVRKKLQVTVDEDDENANFG